MDDDVVWQLWLGRQMNHGFKLYTDLSEVNPPLWFWLARPPVAFADLIHVSAVMVYRMCLALYGMVGLGLIWHISNTLKAEDRRAWMISLCLSYYGIGWVFYGQREHMVFMAVVVYLFLCVRRAEQQPVSMRLALMVGLYAAIAVALKHYFSLVIIGLELWVLYEQRRCHTTLMRKLLRPELITLIFCAIVYVLMIILFAPAYLRDVVPLIRLSYQHYDYPLWTILNERSFFLIITVAIGIFSHTHKPTLVTRAMLLSAIIFFSIVMLQSKGFFYHYFDVYGLIVAVASYQLITSIQTIRQNEYRNIIWSAIMSTVLIAAAGKFLSYALYQVGSVQFYSNNLASLSNGPVALLSSRAAPTITASQMVRLGWAQRYYTLWMAPLINTPVVEMTPAIRHATDNLRKTLVDDLLCQPPDILLVDNGKGEHATNAHSIDYIAFFKQDMRFAKLIDQYDRKGDIDYLMVYKERVHQIGKAGCHSFDSQSIFEGQRK